MSSLKQRAVRHRGVLKRDIGGAKRPKAKAECTALPLHGRWRLVTNSENIHLCLRHRLSEHLSIGNPGAFPPGHVANCLEHWDIFQSLELVPFGCADPVLILR